MLFNEGRSLSEFKQLNFTNDTKDIFLKIITKSEAKEQNKNIQAQIKVHMQ